MGARASADSISPKYPLQSQKSVEFAVHPGSTAHGISICPTTRMSARVTGITGLDKPICPNRPGCMLVKRISQAATSLSAQSPGCLLAKCSLQVTTTWISVLEIEAKGHDHPDGLLILLKIPLNCLFHSLCIQRICLCLISCNQLNRGDDSICNIILLLGHGTSDIGAVIY